MIKIEKRKAVDVVLRIEGIAAILSELKSMELNFVLETPPARSDKDLEIVKEIRDRT